MCLRVVILKIMCFFVSKFETTKLQLLIKLLGGGGMQNSNGIDKFDFNESFIFYSEELGFYQFF